MIENHSALIFVVSALVASWLLGFGAYKLLAAFGIIDRPNERSSHDRPTVRGGGIAIMATILAGGCWLMWRYGYDPLAAILCSALMLAVISFLDDMKSFGPAIRFGCHLVAAIVALTALGISNVSVGLAAGAGVAIPNFMMWTLALLWVAGYTNAFNFMDGINGIAAGQATVTGFGMMIVAGLATGEFCSLPLLTSALIAASTLGFLPHNFPKARMFMGDVSSAPLGFLLAVLALWLAKVVGWWLLVPLALLHTNYVLDTTITLTRRVLRGERWYDAHREHFYQRLIRSGRSHTFVTLWEIGLQVVVVCLMIVYLYVSPQARIGLIFSVVAIWLLFFAYCEAAFHRSMKPGQSASSATPKLP